MKNGIITRPLADATKRLFVGAIAGDVCRGVNFALADEWDMKQKKGLCALIDEIERVSRNCGFVGNAYCTVADVGGGRTISLNYKILFHLLRSVIKAGEPSANAAKELYEQSVREFMQSKRFARERLLKLLTEAADTSTPIPVLLYCAEGGTSADAVIASAGGGQRLVRYPAFALTEDDLTEFNESDLIPAGLKIASVRCGGILPHKRGVIALLNVVPVEVYLEIEV